MMAQRQQEHVGKCQAADQNKSQSCGKMLEEDFIQFFTMGFQLCYPLIYGCANIRFQ
jgi:hypothetical protein